MHSTNENYDLTSAKVGDTLFVSESYCFAGPLTLPYTEYRVVRLTPQQIVAKRVGSAVEMRFAKAGGRPIGGGLNPYRYAFLPRADQLLKQSNARKVSAAVKRFNTEYEKLRSTYSANREGTPAQKFLEAFADFVEGYDDK